MEQVSYARLQDISTFGAAIDINGTASLSMNQGNREGSLSMRAKIIRNRGMVFSLYPLAIVEAARIYVLPDVILLYDLINKNRVEISYAQLSNRIGGDVSYQDLQDILVGEASMIGHTEQKTIAGKGSIIKLTRPSSQEVLYHLSPQGSLMRIEIPDTRFASPLQIKYTQWTARQLPKEVWFLLPPTMESKKSGASFLSFSYQSCKVLTANDTDVMRMPKGAFSTISLDDLLDLFL